MALTDEITKRRQDKEAALKASFDNQEKQAQDNLYNEREQAQTTPISPEPAQIPMKQPVTATLPQPDYSSAVKSGRNLLDVIQEYNKPYDFTNELKQAERGRKAALFSDMIAMGGNALTAALGRRNFSGTTFATPAATSYIDKLRNARLNQKINSQNILREAAVRQFGLDREDERYNRTQERLNKQFQADQAYKGLQLRRQLNNDASTQAYRDQQLKGQEANRKLTEQRLGLAKQQYLTNTDIARQRLKLQKDRVGSKTPKMDYFYDDQGKKIPIPKELFPSVSSYAYQLMQDEAAKIGGNVANEFKRYTRDRSMNASKINSIVRRHMADFPEVAKAIRELDGIKDYSGMKSLFGNDENEDEDTVNW